MNLDLIIHNWRCFDNTQFCIPASPFMIVDENGSGKTSLLSAIYSLYTGQPWPSTKFSDSLKNDCSYYGLITGYPDWSLTGQINSNGRLISRFQQPDIDPTIRSSRPLPKVFTYLPTDNMWLDMSRVSKISSLDSLLSLTYDQEYSQSIKQLSKYVKSKNELIRHVQEGNLAKDPAMIISLSNNIFNLSKTIWDYRSKFFHILSSEMIEFQKWINNKTYNISIKHESTDRNGMKHNTVDYQTPDWLKLWEKEIMVGKCLYGAQRDDFNLQMGHTPIQNLFSRGEMRLLILFIKSIAQKTFLKNNLGQSTFWMLDDVFNELDFKRELIFFQEVLDKSQSYIITSTKSIDLPLSKFSVKELAKK